MLKQINVKATTLPDAWFDLIYKCVEFGREFKIDEGSFKGDKRLEFDYATIHITNPSILPLLPQLSEGSTIPNPVSEKYLNEYLLYIMSGEIKKGESYTYGSRMHACDIERVYFDERLDDVLKNDIFENKDLINSSLSKGDMGEQLLSQVELMIWTYKNQGYRNNQMVLQIAQPSDILLKDPPCLRHIDTRIQDGKLHFFPYFRSWDLFSGLPANLAAIEILKQYCADQIGVINGEIIASSKGLHLYRYVWELAGIIRGKTIEEFRKEQIID